MKGPRVREGGTVMRRYALIFLIAVELLMSFSFLGYFHIDPISITTAYIPVLLAGALTGPAEAAAVGTVFGLVSMWKASASYVMAGDQLFSPFLSGDPLGSVLLSVGSRFLFGLAAGLLYAGARRLRPAGFWVAAVSFCGKAVHALMVYSVMGLFFPEAGFGPADALSGFFKPLDIASNLITAGAVLALWLLANSQAWLRFQRRVAVSQSQEAGRQRHWLSLIPVILVTAAAALAVTFYFVHRIDYVLEINGIELTGDGYSDVAHLQVQFLFGIISLMVLVALFLILNRQYAAYAALEGKLDSLTGVMTRRAFFDACRRALRSWRPRDGLSGYFVMADLDCFKEINDTHGHPEGDRALKEVARSLREVFGRECLIGRMGGDEFALLLCGDLSEAEMEVSLRHFLGQIRKTPWDGRPLTCSIGVLRVRTPLPPEELYLEADRLLYTAKERGRNQYVIGPAAAEAAAR